MTEKNYEQVLEDLHSGKIDQFEIKPEEFQAFQPIFHGYQYRTQIEAQAHRGGTLTYRLKKR
ncbi:MAG: hypothetical protein H9843_02860 [Candidatus Limosilactobacillus merdavium]|uniref:Uncharacterized protein n=1 Tax=Candidatus Limosilactobacillus merdavium TaxID=2838651 RepID=A0A9E2NV35_9LACO|nr:hypothetical protein [Candidatus Limosilactobacillus merdavium]